MIGCLLIHGFTGSPEELRPLAEYLHEHTDWQIHTPTLPGHGEGESMSTSTWRLWLEFIEKEYLLLQDRCTEIYVIGFSMGGMIAAYLASKYSVSKLVLLSAAVFCLHPKMMIQEVKEAFMEPLKGQKSSSTMERYKYKIKQTPLRAVYHFRRLVWHVKPRLRHITSPILIVQGEKDMLVQPRSATYIYQHVHSSIKELFYLGESKHIVCHDCEQKQLFEKVENFLFDDVSGPVHSLSVMGDEKDENQRKIP